LEPELDSPLIISLAKL
jgi:hypothetical protein